MAEKQVEKQVKTYSKACILVQPQFARYIDMLAVMLKDGKSYTFEQVDQIIKKG